MADAVHQLIRTVAPEKLCNEVGSDGFVKAGFDTLSAVLNQIDLEKTTAGAILLLYVDKEIAKIVLELRKGDMSWSFPFCSSRPMRRF